MSQRVPDKVRTVKREIEVTQAIHSYVAQHSTRADPVLLDLLDESQRRVPERVGWLLPPRQGTLLTFLATVTGAEQILDVGTFTGSSALALAQGLSVHGRLTTLERAGEWVEIGRPFWRRAGVEDRIDVILGDAAESIRTLPTGPTFDLVFIDADKPNYRLYLDESIARLSPGGLIVVDNVLWGGDVADPDAIGDERLEALRAFNDGTAADARLRCVMLPLFDGLTLIRPSAPTG